MLRGAQTPAELRQRSERLQGFESVPEVEGTLERLAGRELVERQARRPGEREERWRHLLGGDAPATAAAAPGAGGLEQRVARVEEQLAEVLAALERAGLV
jgi:uncharacterized protein